MGLAVFRSQLLLISRGDIHGNEIYKLKTRVRSRNKVERFEGISLCLTSQMIPDVIDGAKLKVVLFCCVYFYNFKITPGLKQRCRTLLLFKKVLLLVINKIHF